MLSCAWQVFALEFSECLTTCQKPKSLKSTGTMYTIQLSSFTSHCGNSIPWAYTSTSVPKIHRQRGKTVLRAVCHLFISLKSEYKQWHPSKKPTLAYIADMSSNTTNSLFLYFRWYQMYGKEVKSGISFCFMQTENLSTAQSPGLLL